MFQPEDLLLTIAEVSIAYVGFASIVAVLSSSRPGGWEAEDRITFRAMIEVGFSVILLSFIPHTIALAGVPAEMVWPTASAIAVALMVSMTVRRVIQLRRHAGGVTRFGRVFALPITLFSIVLNAANVFVWQAPGPYVIGLVLGLVTASGMFLLLLYRSFPLDGDK